MSNEERVEKKRFTTYLEMDMLGELIELHRKTRLPISSIVQEAIEDVLLKYNGKGKFYEK